MSANTPDVDKLMAEHAKAVTAMNALFDLFPADLRPDPNAPPGRRGAAPPRRQTDRRLRRGSGAQPPTRGRAEEVAPGYSASSDAPTDPARGRLGPQGRQNLA